jgi:23S rRNA (adenine2503-C2)-methyltransferase
MLNLYDLDEAALTHLLADWGEPAYRARQVWDWAYCQKAADFNGMTSLPQALRERLAVEVRLGGMILQQERQSRDGETRKWLLQLVDGQLIEAVLMRYEGVRRTACLSTQAGCAMGCVFCATGQMGFARHLTVGEIVEQALMIARVLEAEGERLSNVVLMGMGEPLHNYDAVLAAIRTMTDPDGMGIGQRRVALSTVGLPPEIRRLAREGLQIRLAISLHAATDAERSALLPINKRYPLEELLDAVREYVALTGRRVTFEWALVAGQNDTPEQAHALGWLLGDLNSHVNLIPLNPTAGYPGKPPSHERVDRFVSVLETHHVPATVRVRRGIDIHAGCGQLRADVLRHSASQLRRWSW